MTGFTPWQAHGLSGIAVIEAQRFWLGQMTATLDTHLHLQGSQQAVGECLEQLLSGLLQSLASEEEAFVELGRPADERHIAEHNELCMEVLELIRRHERSEPVGAQLLQRLQSWLGQHCTLRDGIALH